MLAQMVTCKKKDRSDRQGKLFYATNCTTCAGHSKFRSQEENLCAHGGRLAFVLHPSAPLETWI